MLKRVIVFHSLNDFSGSPNVLSSVIRGLISRGFKLDLYTSALSGGYLSGINGVNYHKVSYQFTRNKTVTLLRFIISQIRYFFISLQYIGHKDVIFYINTIMPFGATLAARLIRKRVIYHVHENPVRKNLIHKIALSIMLRCAHKAIFVSEYLFNSYRMEAERKILVYNALIPDFTAISGKHKMVYKNPQIIMMASSLKIFKGINVFLELAAKLPDYHFLLALNAHDSDMNKYFKRKIIPQNMEILSGTNDLHPLYKKANLVVNLSLPNLCIESFGLTILEAMSYGIPVIVPPAGGITELVEDGINGYKVDPVDLESLIKRITWILSDEERYFLLSSNSRLMAKKFSYTNMINKIEQALGYR